MPEKLQNLLLKSPQSASCILNFALLCKSLLTTLVEQNPEDMGDLYLDVAEAFLDVGEYNSALPLLSSLVCSERYNLAVVWLRHAGNCFLLICDKFFFWLSNRCCIS